LENINVDGRIILKCIIIEKNEQGNLIDIVRRLQNGQPRNRGLIPGKVKIISYSERQPDRIRL
jgi:hypothetical protein